MKNIKYYEEEELLINLGVFVLLFAKKDGELIFMFFNWSKIAAADVSVSVGKLFPGAKLYLSPNQILIKNFHNISVSDIQSQLENIVKPYNNATVINTLYNKLYLLYYH